MGMNFEVTITGTVKLRGIDASDQDLNVDDITADLVGGASVDSSRVTDATITIEADVRLEEFAVPAEDIDTFDAENALDGAIEHWDTSLSSVEFEVTASPSGFDLVSDAIGREAALEAYAILDRNGYEVS